MSRASTVKPPALAMPSRRAAVSAGFPVRRRRPDAGDCRHQGEYAGACPFWTGSLFLCLFSFFLLPKGRDLPKHGLRGDLFRIRAGRAGERPRPEGARRQDRLCGERCRVVRKAAACSCRSLWSGKPHAVQGPAVQAVSCGWTGNAARLMPGGTAIAAWGDRLAVAVVPPSSAAGGATGKIFRFFMH